MIKAPLAKEALDVKEKFFDCGQDILRPAKTMIGDTYPLAERERMSSKFNQAVLDEYNKICQRANSILYEQRNLVQAKWLPRYEISRSVNSGGDDWEEMRGLLVDGCLDRLAEVLIANSPLLVKLEYVPQLEAAITKAAESAKKRLTVELTKYRVKRRPGVVKLSEELD